MQLIVVAHSSLFIHVWFSDGVLLNVYDIFIQTRFCSKASLMTTNRLFCVHADTVQTSSNKSYLYHTTSAITNNLYLVVNAAIICSNFLGFNWLSEKSVLIALWEKAAQRMFSGFVEFYESSKICFSRLRCVHLAFSRNVFVTIFLAHGKKIWVFSFLNSCIFENFIYYLKS